jgi:hypothetical protein
MSDSEKPDNENIENTVETSTENPRNLLTATLNLKDSNPKIFFGSIIAIIVVVLIVIMSMGSASNLPHTTLKNLVIGQQYTLKGANSTDEKATISMVATPGLVAFDDTKNEDETDNSRSCKQQPAGTFVKVLDLQDFAGKRSAFAHVEVLTKGLCHGRKGWILAIDMQ